MSYLLIMGAEAKKAVNELRLIGAGRSAPLLELDETRKDFRLRLKQTLSNLPQVEVVEVQKRRFSPSEKGIHVLGKLDPEIESPGDRAAQQARTEH